MSSGDGTSGPLPMCDGAEADLSSSHNNIDPQLLSLYDDAVKHSIRRTDKGTPNAESGLRNSTGPDIPLSVAEENGVRRRRRRVAKITHDARTHGFLHRKTSTRKTMPSSRTPGLTAAAAMLNGAAFPYGSTAESAETAAYCVKVIWPKLLHGHNEGKAWFEAFCQYRSVHHAFHFACAVHSDLVRNRVEKSSSRQIVAHKAAAIGSLKDMLAELDDTNDLDAILLTILALATSELDDASMEIGKVLPFEPHFPTAGWMSVYGRLEAVEVHTKAMSVMVSRIGGLSKVKLPGLAAAMWFASLIHASVHHCPPPEEPYWTVTEAILRSHSTLRTSAGNTSGRAFFTKVAESLPPQALSLFVRLATLDRYMERYRGKEVDRDEENSMVATRNALQHALLSLPPGRKPSEEAPQGPCGPVYEICRLTVVLYSNAVLMGIPPHLGWHSDLVTEQRRLLESYTTTHGLDDASDVLVWALCVGGLAAWRLPHRTFYESLLRDIIKRRKLSSWMKVQRIIVDFIWSEAACKHGAAMLWTAL